MRRKVSKCYISILKYKIFIFPHQEINKLYDKAITIQMKWINNIIILILISLQDNLSRFSFWHRKYYIYIYIIFISNSRAHNSKICPRLLMMIMFMEFAHLLKWEWEKERGMNTIEKTISYRFCNFRCKTLP